jgi:ParB-like chromosome segregation protein Spo0J
VKADWNYKTDNAELSAKLRENIKRNGQLENLVVRELPTHSFEIINGNHRFDVLKELAQMAKNESGNGYFDDVLVYNLGAIGTAAAQRIAIELNETRFESDSLKLAARLKEISEEFSVAELALTMPYSEAELERAKLLTEFDFDDYRRQMEEHSARANEADEAKNDVTTLVVALSPVVQKKWAEWKAYAEEHLNCETDEQCMERALSAAFRYHNQ